MLLSFLSPAPCLSLQHIKTIEKGEQRIQRQHDIMHAIATKLEKYKNPWQELKLQYGQNKGKAYNEEEDRFLVGGWLSGGVGGWVGGGPGDCVLGQSI